MTNIEKLNAMLERAKAIESELFNASCSTAEWSGILAICGVIETVIEAAESFRKDGSVFNRGALCGYIHAANQIFLFSRFTFGNDFDNIDMSELINECEGGEKAVSKPVGHRANDEAITIKRGDLCDCLLLMAVHGEWADGVPLNKWARLHDQLRNRLDEHDAKAKERGWRE